MRIAQLSLRFANRDRQHLSPLPDVLRDPIDNATRRREHPD
jgi:hypothetical protein